MFYPETETIKTVRINLGGRKFSQVFAVKRSASKNCLEYLVQLDLAPRLLKPHNNVTLASWIGAKRGETEACSFPLMGRLWVRTSVYLEHGLVVQMT